MRSIEMEYSGRLKHEDIGCIYPKEIRIWPYIVATL